LPHRRHPEEFEETPMTTPPQVAEAADCLRARFSQAPATGILTGTGLGSLADSLSGVATLDYGEIPHFPRATVPSHAGCLAVGRFQGRSLAVLQGRLHLYEGYTPQEVAFPVRVLRAWGVETLVVTNAAGGLNPSFRPGDLMLLRDHINLTGENPLVGANVDAWGPRFPDMSRVYSAELAQAARSTAGEGGIHLREGVYAGLKGPSLETPAEIRYLRTIGADAVGLSTVTEVTAAVHAGFHILGLSVITNTHDPDAPAPASLEAIIATAAAAAPRLRRLLEGLLSRPEAHARR
jgi:purine-nucleoside phosphorylase